MSKKTPFDKFYDAMNEEQPTNRQIMQMLLYMHNDYQSYTNLWESPFWIYVNKHILSPELRNKDWDTREKIWSIVHKYAAPLWFALKFIFFAMVGNAAWDVIKLIYSLLFW